MKKIILPILTAALLLMTAACGSQTTEETSADTDQQIVVYEANAEATQNTAKQESTAVQSAASYDVQQNETTAFDDTEQDTAVSDDIQQDDEYLNSTAVYIDLSEGSVEITESGTYYLSGTLADGTVTVNVDKSVDTGNVYLVLDGADITSVGGTPICVLQAKNTILELAADTVNSVTQSGVVNPTEDFPSAAVWAKDDLIIQGTGSLTVTTDYNDGISCRDDLDIKSGSITVSAADDGIVGKDSLNIEGGNISIHCGGDGLKASNEVDADSGILTISDGTIYVKSGSQGLEGVQRVYIGGGSITVTDCSEGIESPLDITIEGGTLNITSRDDGINVAYATGTLTITGGSISIRAGGDGLDANGAFVQSGGNVVILSIGAQGENYIDCDGGYTHTGGTVTDVSGNDVSTQSGMTGGTGHGGRVGHGMW